MQRLFKQPDYTTAPLSDLRLLRWPQVQTLVGLSRARVKQLEYAGKFPARVSLSGGTAVAWREFEIRQWIAQRDAEAQGRLRRSRETAAKLGAHAIKGAEHPKAKRRAKGAA